MPRPDVRSKLAVGDGARDAARVRFDVLRRAEVSDELVARIVALYGRAFPRWPFLDPGVPLADHLRWKMESPAAPAAAVVGFEGSRLVVARLVVRHRVRVRGVDRVHVDTPDLAVEPDRQGRGISSAATAVSDALVAPLSDLQVDDSSDPRVHRSRHRADARPIGNAVRILQAVPDPRRLPPSLLDRRLPPAAATRAALSLLAAGRRLRRARSRRPPAPGTIRTLSRPGSALDELFERAAAPFDLIYVTDRERIAWRYCDRRAGPFAVRVLEAGRELLGYLVLRRGAPTAAIVDLLVLPGRDDVLHALALDALAELARGGARGVSCWLPDRHPYRRALRGAGFVTLPTPFPVRYRGQRIAAPELAFLERRDARLHYVMASSDLA